MKRLTLQYLIISILLLTIASCSRAEVPTVNAGEELIVGNDPPHGKKILIVYLSRTKNTKALAEIIHKKLGGDLVALELVNPYPEHYQTTVNQVANENATGYLPPLKTRIDSIQKYDLIFLGFPTWGMQLPPPMKSFLKEYNLKGKTIVPFNTNAGYGVGSSFDTLKELCPDSKVLNGFSTKGGIERDGVLFVMEGEKEKQVRLAVHAWLEKHILPGIDQPKKAIKKITKRT